MPRMEPPMSNERFSIFAKRTTFHGFREYRDSKSVCQKSIWIIVMIACTGMLVFHTYKQSAEFLAGRKATKAGRLKSENYAFPPIWVGVPDWHWISHTKLVQYDLSYEDVQISKSYYQQGGEYNSNLPVEEAKSMLRAKLKQLNLSKLIELFSLVAEESYFTSTSLSDKKFPGSTAFFLINTKNVTKSEFGKSWKTWFEFDFSKYHENIVRNFASKFRTNTSGMDLPALYNMDTGQQVPLQSGFQYIINTDCRIYRQLDECTLEEDADALYTVEGCQLECQVNWSLRMKIYDCIPLSKNNAMLSITRSFLNGTFPLCNLGVLVNGTALEGREESGSRSLTQQEKIETDGKIKQCQRVCVPKCEKWSTTWSVVSFPIRPHQNAHTRVGIIFPIAGSLIIIEEVVQYEWHDLVSDLGGLLGLWLGASMMSLFQLIHLCLCADTKKPSAQIWAGPKRVIQVCPYS